MTTVRTMDAAASNLYVDLPRVTEVLLPDGWHSISPGSLEIGVIVFTDIADPEREPTQLPDGVEGHGFAYFDPTTGDRITGPLSSLLAIRCAREFPATIRRTPRAPDTVK